MKKVTFDLGSGEHVESEISVELSPSQQAALDAAARFRLVCLAKSVARRRILAIIPEWKQANATARAVEIVNARLSGTATPIDLQELSNLSDVLAVVKAIRSASDLVEADIAAGVVTASAQVIGSKHWPNS